MSQPHPSAHTHVRRRGRSFVAIAAMVLAGATVAGCGDDDDTTDVGSATTAPATDDTAADDADAPAGGETTIDIVSITEGFDPSSATVAVGDEVTWVNTDDVIHTTTAEDGTWDSGDLAADEEFTFTPEEPGTYAYVCSIHPSMTGELVVE